MSVSVSHTRTRDRGQTAELAPGIDEIREAGFV